MYVLSALWTDLLLISGKLLSVSSMSLLLYPLHTGLFAYTMSCSTWFICIFAQVATSIVQLISGQENLRNCRSSFSLALVF